MCVVRLRHCRVAHVALADVQTNLPRVNGDLSRDIREKEDRNTVCGREQLQHVCVCVDNTTAAVAHKKQPHSVSAGGYFIEGLGCNVRHPTCDSHFDAPSTKSRKLTWEARVKET